MRSKYKRVWLNKDPHYSASMSWGVSGQTAYIEFRDCSRMVTLDFDWSKNAKDEWAPIKKVRLDKVDKMIKELQEFKKALQDA